MHASRGFAAVALATALASGTGAATAGSDAGAKTCVFRGNTRVGCLEKSPNRRIWPLDLDCNGEVWGSARWLWIREGNRSYVFAKLLSPGRWRVAGWNGPNLPGTTVGMTVRRGPRTWDIYDARSRKVAEAHGLDGAAAALTYLAYSGGLCFPIR